MNGHTLDLVLSSNPDLVTATENLGPIDKSDHFSILITTNFNSGRENATMRFNWKRANMDNLRDSMLQWDWKNSFGVNVVHNYNLFTTRLHEEISYSPKLDHHG